ncbi:ATP-grasp domain-containing protein [Hydrogenophaga sp. BPS33]|uniref:ATP-grasp domain-containing protein n=1 Tax=Hydrogenophaga sp. BPS33 TaxID=2651974 RepID=UPI00131FF783|nr:ATP-grasp domain-containing protein [Hydrogenophaga sp. BPS33]QHE87167.1 ATP-grasp domain-containing protein [Hydrogenophaga sp. BPS33]
MFEFAYEAVFHGPNVCALGPVLAARVRFSRSLPPGALATSCARLRALWPEWLNQDGPATDEETEAARLLAAWALGALNEVRGFLHDAGAQAVPGGARLWVGFHHVGVTKMALELAQRALAEAARPGVGFSREAMEVPLQRFWALCRKYHPDYQARILMEGARARGVPVLPFVNGSRYWQYGWGTRSRVFMESASNTDGFLGSQWQKSKVLSHAVFTSLGVPTPKHRLVSQPSELEAAADVVGWPCVVKPMDQGGGRGVTAGIASSGSLHKAFAHARRYTQGPVMVEAFVPGDDHRLMVVEGRLMAAIRREPSSVVGDGQRTLRELVQALNSQRSSNMVKSRYLRTIASDTVLAEHLAGQGLTLETMLAAGQRVTLRSNANLSSGGVCVDVTAQVHPMVRQLAEAVVQAFGLGTAGLDYITTDIGGAPSLTGGRLIEANTIPGLDAVIAAGWAPETIAEAVLGERPGRIPVTLVVLPEATVAKATDDLLKHSADPTIGWVCGAQGGIGGLSLQGINKEAWSAVRAALRHRGLEALVIVSTPTDLIRNGLPVDKMERAVICGAELPLDWQGVLQRCVAEVEHLDDWDGYVKRIDGM